MESNIPLAFIESLAKHGVESVTFRKSYFTDSLERAIKETTTEGATVVTNDKRYTITGLASYRIYNVFIYIQE